MEFKVVIVDDDSVVLFLHKVLIDRSILPSAEGSFKNGKEALDYISSNGVRETPYLILLDINMPVMNGWDFLEAIQEKDFKENIFVAMVTSSINTNDMQHALQYPQVIDYLEKPLRKEACEDLYEKMKEKLE
ncbi:MAG TPA: response regulator [Salinimicrobium sp.]|nr:response regulator [Salinimicrobium sp.]